jgi:probable HAF family extracellular repeat protein
MLVFVAVFILLGSAFGSWPPQNIVYDLGHFPGGTWAEAFSINSSGLVVGFGDAPISTPDGTELYTRPLAVPVFGPKAGQWFDLGTLGGERTDAHVMAMGVSDDGMIVGHAAISGDTIIHGFAWTPKTLMVDLGTLGGDYTYSAAANVNHSGTLIVGLGFPDWTPGAWRPDVSVPVVWKPRTVWSPGGPHTVWTIYQLNTTGIESSTSWVTQAANDAGQIIGLANSNATGYSLAVLWNPFPHGAGWQVLQLPTRTDYPNVIANDINESGQIVGNVAAADWSTSYPALWTPLDPSRSKYHLHIFTGLTGLKQPWAEALSINDVGDIVGDSYDANLNDYATRWNINDPDSIHLLGLPGDWSWAVRVNNSRVVVGGYGFGNGPAQTAAVKIMARP